MLGLLLRLVVGFGEAPGETPTQGFRLFGADDALAHQALGIELGYRRVLLDLAVQNGLRVAGIVAFIEMCIRDRQQTHVVAVELIVTVPETLPRAL